MKIFNSVLTLTVHVWEGTAASLQVLSLRGQISTDSTSTAPLALTSSICTQWSALRTSDATKEAEGLRLLDQLEKSNCIPTRNSGAINCNLLEFIKRQCGGSFSTSGRVPGLFDPASKAVSSDYDEQRVTGFYIGTGSSDDDSLKAAFETFMSKGGALKGSSAIKNTLQVDKGEHELTISAGTTTGDVSVFTHFTRKTNSLFVILYVGNTRSLQDGTKILNDFLVDNRGKIKTYMISTSREEKAVAERSEEAAERMLQQNSQVASFALDLLCQVTA